MVFIIIMIYSKVIPNRSSKIKIVQVTYQIVQVKSKSFKWLFICSSDVV